MLAVTVLMSCYNASQYLAEAIESVLSQTLADFEFIVVNDGSTDNTLATLKDYAARDPRILVLEKPNTGLADSLNVGMEAARGEWIARMDADDISLSRRLAKQVAFLHENASLVLVGSGCTLIDEQGTLGRRYWYPMRHDALVGWMCGDGAPFPHASAMFHRETAMRIGGYNPRFVRSQDVNLWLRLSRVGRIACLREPLVKIRKHDGNVSNDNSGSTQAIMGIAARVCHVLWAEGLPDPSQVFDDQEWTYFVRWITDGLGECSYLASCREWSGIAQNLRSAIEAGGLLGGVSELIREVLTSRRVCRTIFRRFFHSRIPLRLANDWIQTWAEPPTGV